MIGLCDRVREASPEFPGAHMAHWSVADPALAGATDAETLAAFRETADLLDRNLLHMAAAAGVGSAWPDGRFHTEGGYSGSRLRR